MKDFNKIILTTKEKLFLLSLRFLKKHKWDIDSPKLKPLFTYGLIVPNYLPNNGPEPHPVPDGTLSLTSTYAVFGSLILLMLSRSLNAVAYQLICCWLSGDIARNISLNLSAFFISSFVYIMISPFYCFSMFLCHYYTFLSVFCQAFYCGLATFC